jgi:hypothetical protein
MNSIRSMNRSSSAAVGTGVVLLALLACSFNVIAQGTDDNEPDQATKAGICFCNYNPDGFLMVTTHSCSTGYGPECDTSASGTFCRCVLRVCGDCDDGCFSAGLCEGKKPGDSCSSSNPSARCNAI